MWFLPKFPFFIQISDDFGCQFDIVTDYFAVHCNTVDGSDTPAQISIDDRPEFKIPIIRTKIIMIITFLVFNHPEINILKVIKREVVTKKVSTISAHIFFKLVEFYFGREIIFLLK